MPHNAYRSGAENAQRFGRPAPPGAYCRHLLIAPLIAILEKEISKLSLTAHNVKDENLSLTRAIEYPAGTHYDFTIATPFNLCREFS